MGQNDEACVSDSYKNITYKLRLTAFHIYGYFLALRPNVGQGLLINGVATTQTTTHHSR